MKWQPHCDDLVFPLTANATGVFELIKKTGQVSIALLSFTSGDSIEFPNVFSESAIMDFYVLDPNGDQMEDSDGNDCFRFKITPYTENLD